MDSQWRKSSRSGSNGACVEARYVNMTVEVRDSKNPSAPNLGLPRQSWVAFIAGLKASR
ncbi:MULTISPECIES: DUF397 domain-containing protein [unclassified Micromonospora]|uniref:DUF397 domain-containing protein n=1 Tax=unclassified Micromonospora TaxID=2617518 RepID=UPI0022C38608|nr:DUF397 domain-containing protein [Micromonospora sp. AKA38]GHJ13195.1 hypothetical protein TPA0908_11900 [Micromonospora sp. AKA38]